MPRACRSLVLVVAASAACSSFGGGEETPALADAGDSVDSAGIDGSLVDAGVLDRLDGDAAAAQDAPGPDAAPRAPNAGCVLKDVTRAGMSFTLSPPDPGSGVMFQVTVKEASQGFTNVEILYCTPDTPTAIRVQNALTLSGSPPFRWQFPPISAPAGVTQIAFRADPSKTTYATTRITLQ